ncbi:MAG TPA: glycosyl transferase family 2 [Deltaproteobacteria bacterium]|nr:MAG: hypothetical protein A2Z79_11490 [Deltaproteobacteria bacterium GWA2_55_82]OGQ63492.1 MAG: hypothetical protein A3I81_05675 [Deltaproteobacteria bacterium RIFCSPLOWO2_02_FULL_55_12]OIJ74872.1 MAG: hypothetical protein A2V21_311730 [Deltaproteobacteria bacterium GWC2_55_46]HBG47475.1 glycosyl transferase family 2 [Deltaproteobacteria bacterium]HCY11491.1 glycosyl transferase family 2 [Deltaproteobacteria bacterium]
MFELIFWAGLSVLVYAYIGYPAVLFVLSRALKSEMPTEGAPAAGLPTVAVLIAAYNEERNIRAKIENALAMEYPGSLLNVWVASDGSTDSTNAIARSMAAEDPRLHLIEFPRTGKSGVLNMAMRPIKSEIVLFTDANTECARDSLRLIVRRFADRRVGCVCGRLVYRNPGGIVSGKGESAYWRYETAIKRLESRLGYISGANGALYAIRRRLFEPLPAGTINDDFIISMRVVASGYMSVYEVGAVAYEDVAMNAAGEFMRHVRDGAGHYIAVWHLASLLNPLLGLRAFIYWSHRVFRWAAPFILPALFIMNAFLLDSALYRWTFALQAAFYGAAALGLIGLQRRGLPFLVHAPFYFCNLNLALFIGFLKAVSGRQRMTWERTERA